MGTRNLTVVKQDYQIKIAQYGQYDGYPEGAGKTILEFLQGLDLEKFKEKLKACHFIDPAKLENMPDEQWQELREKQPQLSRETGAKVLQMVMNNESDDFELKDACAFGFDNLFCEWLYLIDLDTNTLTVRHNWIEPIIATYDLDRLPQSMDGLHEMK